MAANLESSAPNGKPSTTKTSTLTRDDLLAILGSLLARLQESGQEIGVAPFQDSAINGTVIVLNGVTYQDQQLVAQD